MSGFAAERRHDDAPEVVADTSPEHITSPDFDGEKIYVPPEPDRTSYPQATFNNDPASYPQVVGSEDSPYAQHPNGGSKALALGASDNSDASPSSTSAAAVPAGDGSGSTGGAGGVSSTTAAHDTAAASSVPKRPWWKRKKIMALIATLALLLIALAIGLGVGLTSGNLGDGDNDDEGIIRQGRPRGGNGNEDVSCEGGLCPLVLSAAVQDDSLYVFARTSSDTIAMRSHNGKTWDTEWTDLGNGPDGIVSEPTVITWEVDGDGRRRIDVIAVSDDSDGTVVGTHMTGNNGSWSSWEKLGGSAGSTVKSCRVSDDRIDLWVTDAESHNITHNWWAPEPRNEARSPVAIPDDDEYEPDEDELDEDEDGGSSSNPGSGSSSNNDGNGGGSSSNNNGNGGGSSSNNNGGGSSNSGNSGSDSVPDDSVYGAWKSDGSSSWDEMNPPKGPAASAPGVVCRETTAYHDLVWYERSGERLFHTQYNRGGSGTWSDLGSVAAGNFVGDPLLFSSSDSSERFDFFGAQEDGRIYTFAWTSRGGDSGPGSYSPLASLGSAVIASSPSVVSPEDDILDVVALGANGNLTHQHYDGTSWADDWEDLGVKALSAPTAVEVDETVWILSLTPDGKLQASAVDVSDEPNRWAELIRTEDLGGDLKLSYLIPA